MLAGSIALHGLLAQHTAPWKRPAGPTADRVIARLHASGALTVTYGPTTDEQASIVGGPMTLSGTRPDWNDDALTRLRAGFAAFAKPRQNSYVLHSLDTILEIEVDEEATQAWLNWVVAAARWKPVGLTRIELRRRPSGRLIRLALPALDEFEGPRPGDKEEPRTRVRPIRPRIDSPPGLLELRVYQFHHYVGDTLVIKDDGDEYVPPLYRMRAPLPSVTAWRTSAGRRLLRQRLREARALLDQDLAQLEAVPLDVIVEPVFTFWATEPCYVILDVLEGLAGIPRTRLQFDAMVAWQ